MVFQKFIYFVVTCHYIYEDIKCSSFDSCQSRECKLKTTLCILIQTLSLVDKCTHTYASSKPASSCIHIYTYICMCEYMYTWHGCHFIALVSCANRRQSRTSSSPFTASYTYVTLYYLIQIYSIHTYMCLATRK